MNNKVKAFQMAIGCDLIGSKMSMAASRTLELELLPVGVKAYSKNSGRVIVIPFGNIKGIEMFPEDGQVAEVPKRGRPFKT